MSNWQTVKLSDIFTLQMGKTPSRDNSAYWNGTHNWVSIADLSKTTKYIVSTKESITDLAVSETGIKATPKDTVVMSFKLSIGKTAVTAEETYTNEAIMSFIDKGVYDVDIDYIFHLFSGKDWSKGTNKAVMGVTLNKATLSQILIPLPPLETQKQIAANLDKVTHTIELCNNILEKLDLLVKSRFVEMFGDADRLIDRWKKKKFADVTINLDSTRKPVKDSDRKKMQGEYAYYGATGVVDHVNDYRIDGTYLLISEDGKALEFRNKDIAFIASGKIWVNNHAHVLQCTDEINMIFLMSYLNYRDISDWVTGIDQKKLNRANMDKIPVGLPPIELQNQFAAFVEQTDKSKSAVKQVLEKAETLKKALMQEYFR